jgi:hypothetical protein
VALVALGLAIGAAFHAVDVVRYGWWPYAFGPPAFRLFWNALLPLDLGLIALLTWRWRAGLVATAVLMVADVAINAYAWLILGFDAFAGAVPVQAGFAATVLALAWRYRAGGPFTTG